MVRALLFARHIEATIYRRLKCLEFLPAGATTSYWLQWPH